MVNRAIVCGILAQTLWIMPAYAQKFSPTCGSPAYPTPAPSKALAIDADCGVTGSGGDEASQNAAKNDFCATGTPEPMTIADMTQLQTQVANDPTINFGDTDSASRKAGPQVNRAPLQAMGEGKLVTLTGYVLFARQEGEESVNCGKNVPDQPSFHDIHIEIVDSPSVQDECAGIVAEMIPHHRPAVWIPDNVELVATANPKLEVRVTGQLMFDSSHFPCANGQGVGDNPKRASLWEIHPIYKFDVCPSGTCTSSAQWVPLDQWLKTNAAKAAKQAATSPQ